jgi:hypothetical protein
MQFVKRGPTYKQMRHHGRDREQIEYQITTTGIWAEAILLMMLMAEKIGRGDTTSITKEYFDAKQN